MSSELEQTIAKAIEANSSRGTKKSKREDGAGTESGNFEEMMILTAVKLALKAQYTANLAVSAALRAFIIPVTSEYAIAGKVAAPKFVGDTKGKKGHGKGAPDSWVATAALITAKAKATDPAVRDGLEAFIQSHQPGNNAAQAAIRVFRVQKAYKSQRKKVIIAFGPQAQAIETHICQALLEADAEEKFGIVPKGALESAAQKIVDRSGK